MWYCNICDKTSNNRSKSKHIDFNSHKHKEIFSVVVKEYESFRPAKIRVIIAITIVPQIVISNVFTD